MNGQTSQVPDGTKIKDKCGWTTCLKLAFFEHWTGYRYCLYHTYYNWRWSGGNKWFDFKTLKLHWPKTRIVKHSEKSSTPIPSPTSPARYATENQCGRGL
jgi:hypothetical protein